MNQQTRLGIVLGLNVTLAAALVIVGFGAHSVGVIAAAGDTAADIGALVLGLLAVTVRERTTHRRRSLAIPVVALINAGALIVVSILIASEAVRRLIHGVPEVHGLPVLVVGAVTMVVLVAGAGVLGLSAADEDLHMRSVLLDTLADAAAAGAVALAGAVIALTGRFVWLDPALAIVIAAVVLGPAARLCLEAIAAIRGKDVDFRDDQV